LPQSAGILLKDTCCEKLDAGRRTEKIGTTSGAIRIARPISVAQLVVFFYICIQVTTVLFIIIRKLQILQILHRKKHENQGWKSPGAGL